jgi:hypothetical protein|tara:strand:- start:8086 stop:8649 length:564 start_codon:yes stop_codon:yes gene_type:complete
MSDTSIYPKAIDGYAQLPLATNKITPVNAESVNRLRSAIVNIETALGVNPQGDSHSTVAERIARITDATLDTAYDGAECTPRGAGRVVHVDSGSIIFESEVYDNSNTLEVVRKNGGDNYNPVGGRAIMTDGDIQTLGRNISDVFANPSELERSTLVPSGYNAAMAGPISVPVGKVITIETTATLLIL